MIYPISKIIFGAIARKLISFKQFPKKHASNRNTLADGTFYSNFDAESQPEFQVILIDTILKHSNGMKLYNDFESF